MSILTKTKDRKPTRLFKRRLQKLFFQRNSLSYKRRDLRITTIINSRNRHSNAPRNRHRRNNSTHRHDPTANTLRRPRPSNTRRNATSVPKQNNRNINNRGYNMAINTFITMNRVFNNFRPSRLIRLPNNRNIRPFITRATIFARRFRLGDPPFQQHSTTQPTSFLPKEPTPPLFSKTYHETKQLQQQYTIPTT